jgi:Helicase conserved C-terminal domain/RNA polymerase recycling family C-terminal
MGLLDRIRKLFRAGAASRSLPSSVSGSVQPPTVPPKASASTLAPERPLKPKAPERVVRTKVRQESRASATVAPRQPEVAKHPPKRVPKRETPAPAPPISLEDLYALLRRPPKFERVRRARVPEPEAAPNEGYRLLDSLRDKVGGLLLLTATPMQLHDFELYSMIELVEPGLFSGYTDFEASREDIGDLNRAVAALRSQRPGTKAIDECLEVLRRYDTPVELLEAATGRKPAREIAAEWLSRRHRLSEALVRNRKAEIGGFTKRVAHRVEVTPSESEIELDRLVNEYIRRQFALVPRGKQMAVGLVLVSFQKMLCSSTRAVAGALQTRASRLLKDAETGEPLVDDPELAEEQEDLVELASLDALAEAELLRDAAARACRITDAKLLALGELVDGILEKDPSEKILIFSQFLGSIEMIRGHLAKRHSVEVFHGQMSREEKDKAHEAFRRRAQILIASEAGGEGRNFQFCRIVVNYDLPWNPMRIEQRIGRVDRVGQTRDVEIYNFAVKGMLDEKILDVLERRIRIFTETVGALDPILESFEDEIRYIALGEGDPDEEFQRLDAELEDEIRQARQLEELRRDFVLDWRSLQRDRANALLGREPRATRRDLEHFCRTAIERFGTGSIEAHEEGGLFIKVPGMLRKGRLREVEEDYRGSFDVQIALQDERLHFFAMGHPLVESIIDNVGDPWWLPATVLESPDWHSDDSALLVDYRLELSGIRNSGCLLSYLATDEGVRAPVAVVQPTDPHLGVRLPGWPVERVERLERQSLEAARLDAIERFAVFKDEHAALVEQEFDRLNRMYASRRGFIDDRITRNEREIARLEAFGTESQKRIIPARKGQIDADKTRLKKLDEERLERVNAVHETIPSFHLRLLGVAMIVPVGRLRELAV